MSKKGIKVPPRPKKRSRAVSGEGRKLLRAALRRSRGSARNAARLLGLAHHNQLLRMLRGEMGETPALRAAILRARCRAERAFCFVKAEAIDIDRDRARYLIAEARRLIETLDALVR